MTSRVHADGVFLCENAVYLEDFFHTSWGFKFGSGSPGKSEKDH